MRLLLVVAAFGLLAGCGGAVPAMEPQEDGTYLVNLTAQNRFSPALGTLPAGANVTFVSQGFHDVQITGPESASSGEAGGLEPGDSWSHTFTVPGTYKLVCHLHSGVGMKATFTVEAAATA